MAPGLLRSTRSAADNRVPLVTNSANSNADVKPKIESPHFTSLRRTTRSTTRTTEPSTPAASTPEPASASSSALNLAKFAYVEPAQKRVKREVSVKTEMKDEPDEPLSEVKDEPSPRKRKSATSKKDKAAYLAPRAKAHPEPARWREQYALIERMRTGIDAPVDTM